MKQMNYKKKKKREPIGMLLDDVVLVEEELKFLLVLVFQPLLFWLL